MRKFVIVALCGILTGCGRSQSEGPVVSPEAAQADTARLVTYLDAEFEEELAMMGAGEVGIHSRTSPRPARQDQHAPEPRTPNSGHLSDSTNTISPRRGIQIAA